MNDKNESNQKRDWKRKVDPQIASDLERAIRKIKAFHDSSQISTVYGIASDTSNSISVTPQTIRGYIKDKKLEDSLRRTSHSEIISLAQALPPLGRPDFAAFSFLLEELGQTTNEIQQPGYQKYNGDFLLHHRFKTMGKDCSAKIKIKVSGEGQFSVFRLAYLHNGNAQKLIGFFAKKDTCLFLFELSQVAVFFAKLKPVVDPGDGLIKGFAFFEHSLEGKAEISPIVLQPEKKKLNKIEGGTIEDHLNRPFDDLFPL